MRRGVLIAVASLLAAPGISCASDVPVACDNPAAATTVQMADNSFSPGCVETRAGTTLTIQNQGRTPHTFTVRQTGLEAKADPGGTTQLAISGVSPGVYEVFCVLHPDMRGALKVV